MLIFWLHPLLWEINYFSLSSLEVSSLACKFIVPNKTQVKASWIAQAKNTKDVGVHTVNRNAAPNTTSISSFTSSTPRRCKCKSQKEIFEVKGKAPDKILVREKEGSCGTKLRIGEEILDAYSHRGPSPTNSHPRRLPSINQRSIYCSGRIPHSEMDVSTTNITWL